jgi:hypothetical protein
LEKRKSIDLPWPAMVAALAGLGGVFLYLNPLQTSRPTERSGFALSFDRPQDVDARLWQDPLRTATEHESQLASRQKEAPGQTMAENNRHSIQHFWDLQEPEQSWLLAVMIPGGSYSEYSEARLRARQAVLEALGAEHFAPADGEHIGYVKIDHLPEAVPPGASRGKDWNWRSMIVPFEWCERKAGENRAELGGAQLPDRVCILWLRDEEFQSDPLTRLNWLLLEPGQGFAPVQARPKIRIIGPRSSTTLLAMVKEAAEFPEREALLQDVEVWSPTATASDALLLHGVQKAKGAFTVRALLEKKLGSDDHPFLFRRATLTDQDVIKVILEELQKRRGLKLGCEFGAGKCKGDRVALVAEWDTFYGRALPLTFEREVCRTDIDLLLTGRHASNFLVFRYLRGIDGMLPGPAPSGDDKNKESEKKGALVREQIEGLNQADYLRRLSRELADQNAQFQKNGEPGIKAVGVLGSDVYDKLLVLEALRGTLPDAIFFTNGLDARFAHPDEWKWTRNLLIASPFGLSVNNGHEDKIPPFRDSDQTAYYAATLFASGNPARTALLKNPSILKPVRLYEVGRKGAFDLTHVPAGIVSIQPSSVDLRRWWTLRRIYLAAGIVFAILAGLFWGLKVIVGRPHFGTQKIGERSPTHPLREVVQPSGVVHKERRRLKRVATIARWQYFRRNRSLNRVVLSSWVMFGLLACLATFCVWVIACRDGVDGEPYSWTDGISIWPTETVRLLICFLSIFYVVKISLALDQNGEKIRSLFFGGCSKPAPALFSKAWWKNPKAWWRDPKAWWRDLKGSLTVRHWKVERRRRVIAPRLWKRYLRCGTAKARFCRIIPLILAYFAAGICLMSLLGWPSVPARGDWARNWDVVFRVCSVGGALFVTFFVVDATLLNRRLIHYLTKGKTRWPRKAFEGLRDRWKLAEQSETPPAAQDVEVPPTQSKTPLAAQADEIPPEELLIDYLDIDLIARRTEIVGGLIYYPFIVLTLLVISRSAVFDHWTWPLPLLLLLGFTAGYATFSAIYLRGTAEDARRRALQRLGDQLIAYTAAGHGDGKEAKTIHETINLIREESRGAFAAISQHPLAGALLLPSGTAGIWALMQYFPRWFTN